MALYVPAHGSQNFSHILALEFKHLIQVLDAFLLILSQDHLPYHINALGFKEHVFLICHGIK